ncbi:putative UPF0481 protein [Iris pallida]|uniref:UPF0481 protein n=1 Tax=Iris pallida TaxID=29817 RepID=A0AAX6GK48_IRIPA|nr:putative UPF0481 protein [Iris pallida]
MIPFISSVYRVNTSGPDTAEASYATRFLSMTSVFTSRVTTGRYTVAVLASNSTVVTSPLLGWNWIPAAQSSATDGIAISSARAGLSTWAPPVPSSSDVALPPPTSWLKQLLTGCFTIEKIGSALTTFQGNFTTSLTGFAATTRLTMRIGPLLLPERNEVQTQVNAFLTTPVLSAPSTSSTNSLALPSRSPSPFSSSAIIFSPVPAALGTTTQ